MQSRNDGAAPKRGTVLPHPPSLMDSLPFPRRPFDQLLRQPRLPVPWQVKVTKVCPDNLLLLISLDLLGSEVPVTDDSVPVQHKDGIILNFPDHQMVLSLFL